MKIYNYVHIACYCALFAGAGIVMKDFSGLSARVSIYSESGDYSGKSLTNPTVPMELKPDYKGGVVLIGRHVVVGTNSTILPGEILGEGVANDAHSLVAKSCEPWSIFAGTPAKRIKARSRDLLLLEKRLL